MSLIVRCDGQPDSIHLLPNWSESFEQEIDDLLAKSEPMVAATRATNLAKNSKRELAFTKIIEFYLRQARPDLAWQYLDEINDPAYDQCVILICRGFIALKNVDDGRRACRLIRDPDLREQLNTELVAQFGPDEYPLIEIVIAFLGRDDLASAESIASTIKEPGLRQQARTWIQHASAK